MLINWTIGREEYYHSYEWFHLMWLGIMVVGCFLAALLASKHSEKTDRKVVLFMGIFLAATEVYKEIFYFICAGYYQFFIFPYQFCTMPVYAMLLAGVLKKGALQEALYKFIAFFGLLAGIAVMAWPEDCLTSIRVPLLIQTMLWHSSMVVVGFYMIISRKYGRSLKKEILPGLAVFGVMTAVAVLLNEVIGKNWDGFNAFFISYKSGSVLPVLSLIYSGGGNVFRWIILIVCYVAAFTLGSCLLFFVAKGIRKLLKK